MRSPAKILRDDRGVAALEFALVAPFLILLFMGTIEFPRAYAISQSLEKSARTMADLISRGSLNSVADVYEAGDAVAYPYDISSAKILLIAVGVYANGTSFVARVCSRTGRGVTLPAVNSDLGEPVPSEAKAGARYVTAKVTFQYVPVFNIFPGLNNLVFSKTVAWPVRGTGANSLAETVLPDGVKCRAT